MRGLASRGPSLACEITSIDVFGAAPDEALQKPELEWLGLRWLRASGRYYDAPADRPAIREQVMVSHGELRVSG